MPHPLLIPISLLLLATFWTWAIINVLRHEQSYVWLYVLFLLPFLGLMVFVTQVFNKPLLSLWTLLGLWLTGILGYWVNFALLGDEKRGLSHHMNRWARARRIAELEWELADGGDVAARRAELAELYLGQGDWSNALRHLKVVLDHDPEDIRSQHHAAVALINSGRKEAALPHLQFIFEEKPDYLTWAVSLRYADLLEELNRPQEALAVLDRIRQRIAPPEVVVRRARLQKQLGQPGWEQDLQQLLEHPEGGRTGPHRPWMEEARRLLGKRS